MNYKSCFILILLGLILTSCTLSKLEKWREISTKLLGTEITVKIFGEEKVEIALPPIPQILKDPKSNQFASDVEIIEAPLKDQEKYDAMFLQELYKVVLDRDIFQDEYQQWMSVLAQGSTREGVYNAIVVGPLYLALENGDQVANEKVILFTMNYMEKYLGQRVPKDKLMGFNFYSLKRLLADKTLDLLDAFKADSKARAAWYAHYSAEILNEAPTLYKGAVRSNATLSFHFDWAEQVPTQHIKSESIIKLHMLLTYLQSNRRL